MLSFCNLDSGDVLLDSLGKLGTNSAQYERVLLAFRAATLSLSKRESGNETQNPDCQSQNQSILKPKK